MTCVPSSVVDTLNLQVQRRYRIRTASGATNVLIYALDIAIGDEFERKTLRVARIAGNRILLGRDILSCASATLDGLGDQLELEADRDGWVSYQSKV